MTKQIITKKKPSYLTGLKSLSSWLFSKRNENDLRNLIEKYEFDNTILKRLASYVYNSPYIVWYINKYMNNIYDFNKFDIVNLLYSFGYLLDINQKNAKKLFYLKSNDLVDKNKTKIKDLLSEYFNKIYDKYYNKYELNFYYDLINLGYISINDITEIDNYINSGKTTVHLEDMTQQKMIHQSDLNLTVLDIYRTLSPEIQQFSDEIRTEIMTRPECQKCELFGRPTVVLDTNLETFGEVDIAFIGLNPGKEEVEMNKPFVGKSGKLLREKISHLPNETKWIISNVILCHTKNEKDIKNPDLVISNCSDLLIKIFTKFPAKCYVPLGAKAASALGITKNITAVSGKKLTSATHTIIPLIHPSSAVNYGQMERFTKDFETIYELFKIDSKPKQKIQVISKPTEIETNVSQEKFITTITPDLTFFDVKEVGDKIIKIFLDQNGVKKYLIENHTFKFYLKYGDWKSCNQITDKVDGYVEISGKDKSNVIKRVRDRLYQITGK